MTAHLALRACLAFGLSAAGARAVGFDAAAACNRTGLELYRALASPTDCEDLVLSPYSVETALALAYAGADGATRTEMAAVLHVPADAGALDAGFHALRNDLGGATQDIEWHDANGIFAQTGYEIRQRFVEEVHDALGGEFFLADFSHRGAEAAGHINNWVADMTNGRIMDLVSDVDPRTRLVLVNAVYLKAPWTTPFSEYATRPEPFFAPNSPAADVPTMNAARRMGTFRGKDFRAVALPYQGARLQLLIILPDQRFGAAALGRSLGPEILDQLKDIDLSGPKAAEVHLHLPKFRLEPDSLDLVPALVRLGMRSAFDRPAGSANFQRASSGRLAITDVLHKAWLIVDEKGSEAAAATSVTMVSLAIVRNPPETIEFRVDHPFLFAIQDRQTGLCLFLGSVANPKF